jgi:CheY-like chemotaxis protein
MPSGEPQGPSDAVSLDGVRVLVVEDDALLALDLDATLASRGCAVVGPFGTAAGAIAEVKRMAIDAAVLDLNLNGETSISVADALAGRDIPYLFLSGYDREVLPDTHKAAPLLRKPHRDMDLIRLLTRLLHRGG